MTPTLRGAVLVGLAALPALLLPVLGVALVVLAVVALVVDAARVRKAPTVRRDIPTLLSRGVASPWRLTVLVGASERLEVAQPAPADLVVSAPQPVAGADGRAFAAEVTASRRGRHLLPAVQLRRTGPLGLGAWVHEVAGETPLTVYPDLPTAHRLARAVRLGASTEPGQSLRGPLGLGTDFDAIRDYLPDDDVRLVNWRATARLQRPMSNSYRVEQSRSVVLALDCGRLMAAPPGPASMTRLDAGVDVVAALALVADAAGDRCGLLAFDDGVRRQLRPRTRGATAVLRAVHDLEPRQVDSDYELALAALGRGSRAALLLVTDLYDEAAARPLLAALPALTRRHAVTVVSATDETLAAALRRTAVDTDDVLLAGAVVDLLDARRRTVALLRRAGVTVVEASAARLPAATVAAYLTTKSRVVA